MCKHTLNSPALIHEGWVFFVHFYCKIYCMSNILQNIFIDYYEHILYELHPRQTEIENISKMIHCGDPSYGGAFFACPDCGELKFVPFRCKSRFCPPAETCIIKNVFSHVL